MSGAIPYENFRVTFSRENPGLMMATGGAQVYISRGAGSTHWHEIGTGLPSGADAASVTDMLLPAGAGSWLLAASAGIYLKSDPAADLDRVEVAEGPAVPAPAQA